MGEIEIYNEFSLQHELGIFLRRHIPDCEIAFERIVSFFFSGQARSTKREIDISVFSTNRTQLRCAIELKFSRNSQYSEQMFSFCKDVAFVEELKATGFSQAGLVNFADDPLFYRGPGEGIYAHFRAGSPLTGRIQKPTGRKDSVPFIRATYDIKWERVAGSLMRAVIEAI